MHPCIPGCAVEVDEVMHNTVINALGRSQQAAEAPGFRWEGPGADPTSGFQVCGADWCLLGGAKNIYMM